MKSFLASLSLILLLSSCGGDSSSKSGGPPSPTPPPQEEEERSPEREASRYPVIVLGAAGFAQEFRHEMQMNLDQGTVTLSGNFQDAARSCTLQLELTSAQSQRIVALANALRVCTHQTEDDVIIETNDNFIALTQVDGSITYANKELSGQDEEVYLCQGKISFYNYVRTLVRSQLASEQCPENSLSAFFTTP